MKNKGYKLQKKLPQKFAVDSEVQGARSAEAERIVIREDSSTTATP